jgi:hypothetical protein
LTTAVCCRSSELGRGARRAPHLRTYPQENYVMAPKANPTPGYSAGLFGLNEGDTHWHADIDWINPTDKDDDHYGVIVCYGRSESEAILRRNVVLDGFAAIALLKAISA